MPTLVIHERETVEYDLYLEYDADWLAVNALNTIQSPRSILRSGEYLHSRGSVSVPKGQDGHVVYFVKTHDRGAGGRKIQVYVRLFPIVSFSNPKIGETLTSGAQPLAGRQRVEDIERDLRMEIGYP